MKYVILQSRSIEGLMKCVNEYISNGYQLRGELVVSKATSAFNIDYFQVMTCE